MDEIKRIKAFKNKKQFREITNCLYNILCVRNADQAYKFWNSFMVECGLEIYYKKLGLNNKKIITKITDNVNLERLSNHPVKMNISDLKSIFHGFE